METSYSVLPPTLILAPLSCFSKKRLFEEIAECASAILDISTQEIIDALNQREMAGSTYIANGVAIPHALIRGQKSCAILSLLNEPITFNSIDSDKVIVDIAYSFYFSKNSDLEKNEEMLNHLSQILCDSEFITSLRLSHHDDTKIARILGKADELLSSLMKTEPTEKTSNKED